MARRPLPSLTGLRAFEAFARLGAMTRAAEELCVTHGAVSRQIKALEARLGARLIAGPRHALALTPAGRDLAAAVGSAFDMVAAALPGSASETEPLVVSCLGTLAMKWLIPRLPRFLDRHPGVRVRISESHAPADFSGGVIAAALRIVAGPSPDGLRATAFLPHHHGVLMAPALFDEVGRDPARILALPRLSSETFAPAWATWARKAEVDLPAASVERIFEHNSYMLEAAAAGLGAAVAPWSFAEADVGRGRLVAPFGFVPAPGRCVLLRPARTENAAVDAFETWLVEEGRRTAPPPKPLIDAPGTLTAVTR